jgi:hypothetical protein
VLGRFRYTLDGYHIARLNPQTGAIEASTTLPTGKSAPRDTSYNGFDALPDGTIIAKTVNRQKGCTENGFSAFLNCPNQGAEPRALRELEIEEQLHPFDGLG